MRPTATATPNIYKQKPARLPPATHSICGWRPAAARGRIFCSVEDPPSRAGGEGGTRFIWSSLPCFPHDEPFAAKAILGQSPVYSLAFTVVVVADAGLGPNRIRRRRFLAAMARATVHWCRPEPRPAGDRSEERRVGKES